jgi:hypothetical protein
MNKKIKKMKLQEELNKLKTFVGTDSDEFINQYEFICENFQAEEEQKFIRNFVEKTIKKSGERIDDFIEDAKIKLQLMTAMEIV